jgi:alpha-glucosidase
MQKPEGPLELRVYPGPDCKGSVYQDDGTTFDYKKGAYLRENFSCTVADNELHIKLDPISGSYPAWWTEIDVVMYGWHDARYSAMLNGHHLAGGQYNAAQNSLTIRIPQNAAGEELTVAGISAAAE